MPPAFPKPGKGKEICTLCNSNNVVPVCITEPIKLGKYGMREMFISPLINNALPLRVEVLLDTGSIGEEANFISREVAKSLRLVGYNGRKVSKKVCSCFNNNLHSITESFKLKITFYDDNKVLKTVVILADVIDSVHDVIIGYKDIMKKQELRQLLLSDISNHTDNDGYLVSDPELDKFEFCGERSESGSSEYSTGWASSNVMKHKRNQKHRVNLVKRKSLRRQKCRRRHSTAKSNVSALRESEVQILRLDGPIELQSGIRKVLRDFSRVFSNELNKEPALIRPMDIEFHEGSVWKSNTNAGPPRMQSKLKAEDIKVQVDTMLRSGVIEVSKAVAYSQVMLTPKKNGEWRFCIDYRRLNLITKPNKWPLPNIKQMLHRLGDKKAKYFAVIDLTKGYYQAPLSLATKELTAFITQNGLYQWKRVAMGLTGAPGYFQRAICQEVLRELLFNICEIYLDDIIVFGRTEQEFVDHFKRVIQRLGEHNITVNPSKCQCGMS